VFDYAGVKENPWRDRKVKLPRQLRTEVNPPTAEHVVAILERVPAKAVLALTVLEQTGTRIGETISLTFGDFDESGCRLRLRRETTKTSRPRWVPVPEWLAEAIGRSCPREDRTPDRRIFQGVSDERAREWMRKACRDAGIPHYHPHDFRHRRISLRLGQGEAIKDVSMQVGHARASMTLDVYDHVMPLEEIPVETWLRLIGRAEINVSREVRCD
jgi:integrase